MERESPNTGRQAFRSAFYRCSFYRCALSGALPTTQILSASPLIDSTPYLQRSPNLLQVTLRESGYAFELPAVFNARAHLIKPEPPQKNLGSKPTFYFQGIGYWSLSEAACAHLLKETIPGFKIITGQTFQIDLGSGRSADFKIGEVIVEYHHLRMKPKRGQCGDFRDRKHFFNYHTQLRKLQHKRTAQEDLIRRTRLELAENYYQQRKKLIDAHPELHHKELIVVTSEEELFDKVIRRFAPTYHGSKHAFCERFHHTIHQIAKRRLSPKVIESSQNTSQD